MILICPKCSKTFLMSLSCPYLPEDGRLAKNAERASQSGYGRERIWAPEQFCFCFENPKKGGKGTGLGSEQYRFVCLEVPKEGRR